MYGKPYEYDGGSDRKLFVDIVRVEHDVLNYSYCTLILVVSTREEVERTEDEAHEAHARAREAPPQRLRALQRHAPEHHRRDATQTQAAQHSCSTET